jgi:hypothetical protein
LKGESVSKSDERVAPISPADALDTVYRDLVAVHYGLAEHGPTEPRETAMWAMRELKGVLDYIQAIRKSQTASSGATPES